MTRRATALSDRNHRYRPGACDTQRPAAACCATGIHAAAQHVACAAKAGFVVAVVDLPRGASVTPEAVKIKEFPRDLVPAGALSKLEDAVNRVIFVPLTKDEPVLESKLAPKGAGRRTVGTDPPWHAGLLGQGAGCGAGRRRLHPARQPG